MKVDNVILRIALIEQFRRRAALTRTELAKTLGVHFATLLKVLNGKPVALKAAKKIACAMKIDTPKLIESWQNSLQSESE